MLYILGRFNISDCFVSSIFNTMSQASQSYIPGIPSQEILFLGKYVWFYVLYRRLLVQRIEGKKKNSDAGPRRKME